MSSATILGVVLAIALSSVLGLLSSRASAATAGPSLTVEALKGLSAGVLVAVAWLHLLDDGQERLEGLTEYPAANAAMLVGYLVMATVQEVTTPCHHIGLPLLSTASAPKHDSHHLRVFHVLEASISLHSVLIGLGFGLGELDGQSKIVLGLALCVHQFLEGLAVGILATKSGLSRRAWRCTYLVFTLSLPVGVAVGVVVRHLYAGFDDNVTFKWCSGLMNALAAGTLTHIGVHMISAHADEPPPQSSTPDSVTILPDRLKRFDTDPAGPTGPDSCSRDLALRAMLAPDFEDLPGCLPERCVPSRPVLRMLSAGLGAALMAFLAIWA